jgi:copper transport protein
MTSDKNGKIWFVEQEGNKIGTVNIIEIPVNVSQVKTIDSTEIKYTEIASPLIALGIIVTALFYVKAIHDKRRLNSLINS